MPPATSALASGTACAISSIAITGMTGEANMISSMDMVMGGSLLIFD